MSTKTKAEQLQWGRSKVVEMRARGLSQTEIARELQVSKASISLDMQYLRNQAKESIMEYVTEHLPEQYQICLTALDAIIKRAFEILETSPDKRKVMIGQKSLNHLHLISMKTLRMTTFIYAGPILVVDMALGEKLFEDIGNLTKLDVKSVHPVEGVKMEVSFTSEIKGLSKFPSGKNIGSGTVTQYSHGVIDANYQGIETTTEGDQYIWWAHEKSKVVERGITKGIIIFTGYANSQKLSWMNNLIAVIDMKTDLTNQRFEGTGYEWQ